MKLLMIICSDSRRDQMLKLLESHGVHAFTEFTNVKGEGVTGKHLGTRVWPGTASLLFTVVTEEKKDELIKALEQCRAGLLPEEGLKAFVLPAEEVV